MILFRTFSNQPKPGLWSMFFLKSSLSCLKVGQLQLVTAARGNRSGSGFEADELAACCQFPHQLLQQCPA